MPSARWPSGVYDTYQTSNLRYSQLAPLGMYEEKNTKNQPPRPDRVVRGSRATRTSSCFWPKVVGQPTRAYLYQETKALLNEAKLHAVESS